jgi:hypothetical protein
MDDVLSEVRPTLKLEREPSAPDVSFGSQQDMTAVKSRPLFPQKRTTPPRHL